MTKKEQEKIIKIFKGFPLIKLVYLFGSRARGDSGPMSDHDFALYIDSGDKKEIFKIKSAVSDQISRVLKTDKVDILALNTCLAPEIKYLAVKEGCLIYEQEPFRVLIEPRILNEYFDFHLMLKRYELTKAK